MNKKLSLTIGIPAFNEEANIYRLLQSLFSQNQANFKLDKIILVSDGSTDLTVNGAKKIKNKKLIILENKKRLGLNSTQNRIISQSSSDILIIFNADILIKNKMTINRLISHFYRQNKIGIVGARTEIIQPNNFVGKILANSHNFKQSAYKKYNKRDNVYLCHGAGRAFSKEFYKKLKWPENCPEDAYSYFSCIKSGFKFHYASDAKVYFLPSTNLSDYIKQSTRFFSGKKAIEKFFNTKVIKNRYRLPFFLTLSILIIYFKKNPVLTLTYILVIPFVQILSQIKKVDQSKYEISVSSKNFN